MAEQKEEYYVTIKKYIADNTLIGKDLFPVTDQISRIIKHVYISDFYTACDKNILDMYDIRAIICLEQTEKDAETRKFYSKKGIKQYNIPIIDGPLDSSGVQVKSRTLHIVLEHCYGIISSFVCRGENILIHCVAGVSRSALVVVYYLLKQIYTFLANYPSKCQISMDNPNEYLFNVIRYVKSRRNIRPNGFFIKFLIFEDHRLRDPSKSALFDQFAIVNSDVIAMAKGFL